MKLDIKTKRTMVYTPTEKIDHPLGWSESERRRFAEGVVDWFLDALSYFRSSQWEEKKKDPKNRLCRETIIKRTGKRTINDFEIMLEGITKARYLLRIEPGPFATWQELYGHVERVVGVVEQIVRELGIDDQSRRLREILIGYRSV